MIVYPTKDSMKRLGGAVALIGIWLISFLMASPALLFSKVQTQTPLPLLMPDLKKELCFEDPSMEIEKCAYSVAQVVVQYVFPFIILSVAHLRICNKLRYRMVTSAPAVPATAQTSTYQRNKNARRNRRKRKTNWLLAAIALVFALSWLPLNVFNLLVDFWPDEIQGHVDPKLAPAICHLLVLTSACLNPVLYGWLNDNFRAEFNKVLCCPCCVKLKKMYANKCCKTRRGEGEVPAITLTRVKNGHTLGLDNTETEAGREKASPALTLQYTVSE